MATLRNIRTLATHTLAMPVHRRAAAAVLPADQRFYQRPPPARRSYGRPAAP